jgi:hypothetical protein
MMGGDKMSGKGLTNELGGFDGKSSDNFGMGMARGVKGKRLGCGRGTM